MLIVVDVILKASVILAAASVMAATLRRASASARHLVWALGLVGALAAPALAYILPHWEVPVIHIASDAPGVTSAPSREEVAAASAETDTASQRVAGPPAPSHRNTRNVHATSSATAIPTSAVPSAARSWTWRSLLFLAWVLGAAFVTARVLLGLAAVQWMTRRTALVTDAPWLPLAQSLAGSLGLRRVRFLRTEASSMPMAWGILRASVLMPADADRWPADRLRIVLLHELAHVKRRDCLTHLVAQLACAAYWFNPLAWMAARRLRTERERACDDLVLAAGTDGPDYADQLLEIARVLRGGRFPAILAGASLAMAHRSQLEGRLMAILDPTVPRRGLTTGRALAASAFFGALLVSVASVQPWAEENATGKTRDALLPAAAVAHQAPAPAPAASPDGQAQPKRSPHVDVHGRSIHGIAEGIAQGVTAGISEGVSGGISHGIAQGVKGDLVSGITGGVVEGIAGGVGQIISEAIAQGTGDKTVERRREGRAGVDPRTIAALIEALKDTDKDVRETAMQALSVMRDPRVFEPLVAALKDASADVREKAAFGLGQLRDARAVEPLASALKDVSGDVREQVVFALGQLHAVSAIDALTTALHDTDDDVREQAAFALGQLHDRRAVDPLISGLKDEKPDVREQAAFALGQLHDTKAVEALVIALKDVNASVREQAAFALGQLHDPRAIDGLTVALKDTNASVRQQAAFALGQIR